MASKSTLPVDTIVSANGLNVIGGIRGALNYMQFSANTTQPTIPASGPAPVYWNTTPITRVSFPEFATTQWSNGGSQWCPGRAGVYDIIWSCHSGAMTSEAFVLRNTPSNTSNINAFGSPAMVALYYGLEAGIPVKFYSSNTTDYVSFGIYSGSTSTSSINASRNYLTIYRCA